MTANKHLETNPDHSMIKILKEKANIEKNEQIDERSSDAFV